MHAPIIADCLNYDLRFTHGVEDVGILLTEGGPVSELRGQWPELFRSVPPRPAASRPAGIYVPRPVP